MLGTFLHHRIFYLFANDDMQMKVAYSDFAFLYFITQMNVNIYICVKMCMKRVKYFANTSIFNKSIIYYRKNECIKFRLTTAQKFN